MNMTYRFTALTVFAVLAAPLIAQDTTGARPALVVHTDFSSGSGQVIAIDQDQRSVSIRPTPHPGRGWACWWYFRLTGVHPGETIIVEVGDAPWATPDRAAFSTDNRRWTQTAPGQRRGQRIAYRQVVDTTEAWFAWGPPFTVEDAAELVRSAAEQCESAELFELCKTREERSVPALTIAGADRDHASPMGIWVQARQHAWESGSSWVCRGLVDWLTSNDPRAVSLRRRAVIFVVPVMDVDNVAIGAGGKNQHPHDHNRDWIKAPHWKSVAAAMQKIREMDRLEQFHLFIDLHNPSAGAKEPFFYVPPGELLSDAARGNLERLLTAARGEITGPLAFHGQVQESGRTYDDQWQAISKNWVSENCRPHVVAVTLETAWNTPHSTTDGYQTLGRQLGLAVERYVSGM